MSAGTPLWTRAEALAATGGRATGQDWSAFGVSIDSRTVAAGDLFIALRGPSHDAHGFVADALAQGASAALVSEVPDGVDANAPLIVVPDTLHAMEDLGRRARARVDAEVVAITGSVGKTGTRAATEYVLGRLAPTHASVGSFNNHWGVPLSLARMPQNSAYGVFEIGMNHAGEIEPLVAQVRPHVAVITNVEAVHLEFFESITGIADAKAEIFTGVEPGGVAVLGRDGAHFDRLRNHARTNGIDRIRTFGEHDQADVRLVSYVLHRTCSTVKAEVDGRAFAYKIGAPGRHWVSNSLAVLAAVDALGGDLAVAGLALADIKPPAGRGARHEVAWGNGQIDVIDESYNASPVAMRAAFDLLAAAAPGRGGRRIAVLGDMRELGGAADDLHRELAAELVDRKIDRVYCCGPHMAALYDALPNSARGAHAPDSDELLPPAVKALRAGDVVLVKGSLGSRMKPIVEAILRLADDNGSHPTVGQAGGGR